MLFNCFQMSLAHPVLCSQLVYSKVNTLFLFSLDTVGALFCHFRHVIHIHCVYRNAYPTVLSVSECINWLAILAQILVMR